MTQATITEIGTSAINPEESMLILFDQSATSALRDYTIIQEFSTKENFSLETNDWISFDHQEYTIEHVGPLANENLTTVGHVTLVFEEPPKGDKIVNGIYLSPYQLPEINVGTIINYKQVK
ncbi:MULTISPECIES: PTS glucitol/sorbitol transporter subunit IIA [unclassified Enterococcus]|uniref:PTS glucitol/sorbitol transporter subunit IIA n=1 Tax=unclassified Enterococcus TaxID=2608891 RepID=UPI001A9B107A|nr:PTS glucitol/sorbitol transporter subunit IIA [Enterococcus sp. DIV1271a]MBO1300825.1 PTS glucitol/sorbitol transporter subunit IIA [Enterococcus sp. DIV1271a]